MRQTARFKVREAATVAALCGVLSLSILSQAVHAQDSAAGGELLRYPGTSLRGLTSAETRSSLGACSRLCVDRQGCVGFDHQAATNQCRLFASVGSATPDPSSNAGTRSRIAGYRATTPPPDREGIQTSTLDVERAVDRGKAVERTAPGAQEPAAPYDPMGTVTAFYSALAAADGESASAHVVPEKRGRGPFSVVSIQSFFGAMSQPLTLTGTALHDRDNVRVSYDYVTDQGRRCRGRADVTTVYIFGKTLISQIKALDGC
ncbi:PAN domain-containing protein [Sinorhizobium sp. 8-89]|uniref:PAN domain-containing protein n=1 Tax=Sinorhizobium sp. 7-81 TaxID=3049087 RepID=UPI0024C42FEA|nr:PAN domain-containing protein [Sinorhizobium sp. 7-81]MDK1388868.1 PAN domain-containing protein [Sinorhizobium sp. 7-81]